METLASALRMISKLLEQGNLDNALWEINELEKDLKGKNPSLMEKYHLRTYFTKWRTRLLRTSPPNLRLVLDEIELLAKKLEHVLLD